MQLNKDLHHGLFKIHRFEPGNLLINDQTVTQSVILCQDQLINSWPPQQFSDLSAADFDMLIPLPSKLIIFGTGKIHQFPNPKLYANALNQGKTFEFMSSQSACHTYTILQAENRDVACALLIR